MKKYRIIISGGGTGGHIFPAISIANTFKKRFPDAEILFVGADVIVWKWIRFRLPVIKS